MKGQGLILDATTANAHVDAWLRDVANPRIHAETKARPVDRLPKDVAHLLPRGPAWQALAPSPVVVRTSGAIHWQLPADLRDISVRQHDLSIYDAVGGTA